MPNRVEVVEFRKFLQAHSEAEIRQGVLHRDPIGIAFITLQKKALSTSHTSYRESERPLSSQRMMGG
jgi:hypothetical protein